MARITARSVRNETEQVSELIGDICDAALDPTLWVGVFGKAREFVGGLGAALAWEDAVGRATGGCTDGRIGQIIDQQKSASASQRTPARIPWVRPVSI
jgi:hypothetical protein